MLGAFGRSDPFKPPACWRELQDQFGVGMTSVPIPDASHAPFPE